jgi:hypothetical protein
VVAALTAQGLRMSQESDGHVTVYGTSLPANVEVTDNGFEVSAFAMGQPLSCGTVREAAPFLRSVVQTIREECSGSTSAEVSEHWNQDSCSVTIVAN